MFVFTTGDVVGLIAFGLLLLIGLLVHLLLLLARLRSWLRRKWDSLTSRWSRAHA